MRRQRFVTSRWRNSTKLTGRRQLWQRKLRHHRRLIKVASGNQWTYIQRGRPAWTLCSSWNMLNTTRGVKFVLSFTKQLWVLKLRFSAIFWRYALIMRCGKNQTWQSYLMSNVGEDRTCSAVCRWILCELWNCADKHIDASFFFFLLQLWPFEN